VNTVPAERDLPPAARDTARARAVAAVEHRSAGTRRWLPVAAAAALAVVVAGTTVAVSLAHDQQPPATAPPPVRTASPSPSAAPTGAGPVQVDPLRMTRISPDATLQAQVGDCGYGFRGARIRLAVRTPYSTLAVVAPGADAFACGVADEGGSGSYTPQLPSSPMAAPVRSTGPAETPVAAGLALSTVEGKVTAGVRRVTLTYAGHVLDATLGNGVYVGGAVLRYHPGGLGPRPLPEPVIRAYDANGRLLYEYDRPEVDAAGRGDVSCPDGPGNCRYPWP
jgi:hypothetical protein